MQTPQRRGCQATVALVAGLAPHLFNEFRSRVSVDRAIWKLLPLEEIATQQQLLLALFSISEGSDFFLRSPEDGAIALHLLSYDALGRPELAMFRRALQLSILSGGATPPLDPAFRDRRYVEHFATKSCIVSVIGNRHIIIRHSLGAVVYDVTALPPSPTPPTVLAQGGHCDRPPIADAYESVTPPEGDFMAAVEALEANMSGPSSFPPHSIPESSPSASAAHALLCDLGFISPDSDIRRIPPQLAGSIDALDATPARSSVVVFVLQLGPDGLTTDAAPALSALLRDLVLPECGICHFRFVTPGRYHTVATLASHVGIVVILNESGLVFNDACPDLELFSLVLVVAEEGGGYAVEVICRDVAIFGDRELPLCPFRMQKENLARFVALCAYLFFAAQPRTLPNGSTQIRGPEYFMAGFYARGMFVTQIYEKAEGGRNAILAGAISCGMPDGGSGFLLR
jgi:hypothetical protein